jgi:hypothetical protein
VAQRRGSLAANRTTTRLGGPAVAANMAINMPKFLKKTSAGMRALQISAVGGTKFLFGPEKQKRKTA